MINKENGHQVHKNMRHNIFKENEREIANLKREIHEAKVKKEEIEWNISCLEEELEGLERSYERNKMVIESLEGESDGPKD